MNRLLCGTLLCLCAAIPARGQTADSFLTATRNIYDAAADFKASFECLRTSGATGSTLHSKGTIEARRPDRFRIEWDKPEPRQAVYDGKVLWVYRPKDRTVTASTIRNAADVLCWLNPYDKLFPASVIDGARTDGEYQIWLSLPEYKDTLKEVKMIVNRGTGLITGFDVTDVRDNTYEYIFTKMKLGAGIKDARFEFTVPSGSRVIENY